MLLLASFGSIQQLNLGYPERKNDHVNIYSIHSMSCLGGHMKNTIQSKDILWCSTTQVQKLCSLSSSNGCVIK